MLEKMLTEETPAKIMGLLTISLASLAFLFVVTATDATFQGTTAKVYNPFAPEKVVAVIDSTAATYTNFLQANLFNPVEQSVAMTTDNVSWIVSNAAYSFGIQPSSETPSVNQVSRVAGAHVSAPPVKPVPEKTSQATSQSSGGVFSPIFAILTN